MIGHAESIYFLDKYVQPIHTVLHSQEPYQTTALYQPFRQPIFTNKLIPDPNSFEHPSMPGLKIPQINAPWVNNEV